MRTVLFDLDGTLLLTGGAGVRGMNRAGRKLFGEHFSLEGVAIAGGLDPVIFRDAAERCGIEDHAARHDEFRELYLQALADELASKREQAVCLPGVQELLSELRTRTDVLLGLVTGNYRGAAPIKMRAAGIAPEQFRVTGYGDEAPSRPDVVALAMSRQSALVGRAARASDFLVVGDTPRDIECAHAHGIPCLAVATGVFSVEQLQAAGADVVSPNLADPAPLYDLLRL